MDRPMQVSAPHNQASALQQTLGNTPHDSLKLKAPLLVQLVLKYEPDQKLQNKWKCFVHQSTSAPGENVCPLCLLADIICIFRSGYISL